MRRDRIDSVGTEGCQKTDLGATPESITLSELTDRPNAKDRSGQLN
jgi:hypothetical protein